MGPRRWKSYEEDIEILYIEISHIVTDDKNGTIDIAYRNWSQTSNMG